MAESAKGRTTRKKGKRRSTDDEYASYVVRIEDWDWAFNFGIGNRRFNDGPYLNFRHLHLRGKLIAPSRIKTETVQVILIPRRIQTYECNDQMEPTGVGSVSVSRGRFEALLTMPHNALVPVLQMLIAEKLKFIDLHGERMRYRNASIKSYRLEMNIDLDDMPADA